eukprot:1161984-Pelagomonas_calceolata.AAC.3
MLPSEHITSPNAELPPLLPAHAQLAEFPPVLPAHAHLAEYPPILPAHVSLLEKAVRAQTPPNSTTAIATTAAAAATAAATATGATVPGTHGVLRDGSKVSTPAHTEAAAAASASTISPSVMPAGAVRDSSNISAIPGLLQLRLPAMPLTQTAAVPKPPTMVATQPAAAAHAPEQQGLGEVLTPAGGGGIEGDICTRPEEDTATGPPIEVLTIDKYQVGWGVLCKLGAGDSYFLL